MWVTKQLTVTIDFYFFPVLHKSMATVNISAYLCINILRYCFGYFYITIGTPVDPRKVLIVAGHHNWIVAAYAHFVICYR